LAEALAQQEDSLSPHDRVLGAALVEILSGDTKTPVPLSEITERVTRHFLELVLTDPTRARIAHMLETGKPLKN
jgi:3-hydroxyacyl-CoA dehydrogenase